MTIVLIWNSVDDRPLREDVILLNPRTVTSSQPRNVVSAKNDPMEVPYFHFWII